MAFADVSGLASELGTEPPHGLVEVLTAEELRTLAESLALAKQRQSRALDAAIQEALRHVPFVLPGTAELFLT
jgi:hypothetical protein